MGQTLSIRLDGQLARRLEEEASRSNQSKGRIVRQALEHHLGSSRASAFDLLHKYAGVMKGPADLSTNKVHLSGLGRRRRR